MKRGSDGRFLKRATKAKAAPARKRKATPARNRKRARKNPPGGLELMLLGNPPPVAEAILGELHELRYRHAETGVDHVHDFGAGASIYCMSDGSIWIRNPRRRLWKEF